MSELAELGEIAKTWTPQAGGGVSAILSGVDPKVAATRRNAAANKKTREFVLNRIRNDWTTKKRQAENATEFKRNAAKVGAAGLGGTALAGGAGYGGYKGYQAYQNRNQD